MQGPFWELKWIVVGHTLVVCNAHITFAHVAPINLGDYSGLTEATPILGPMTTLGSLRLLLFSAQ
jgi:hypothetical protein